MTDFNDRRLKPSTWIFTGLLKTLASAIHSRDFRRTGANAPPRWSLGSNRHEVQRNLEGIRFHKLGTRQFDVGRWPSGCHLNPTARRELNGLDQPVAMPPARA